MRTAPNRLAPTSACLSGLALIAALCGYTVPAAALITPTTPMMTADNAMPVLPANSSAHASATTGLSNAMPGDNSLPGNGLPGMPATPGSAKDPNMKALETQATDQIKGVVKHLADTTNDVNLEDLNTARIAVAKLDALIDIEKHLADLEKIRNEREGKTSLAAAIPASAFGMGTMPVPATMPRSNHTGSAAEPPIHMTSSKPTLERVIGANGSYSAVMHTDGEDKTVRIGDHLSDGKTITNITPTSVSYMHDGSVHQLKVEGVDTVYGHNN